MAITSTGSVTGRDGTAIFAYSHAGSVTIDTGTGSIVGGGNEAIYARAFGGTFTGKSISITTRGQVTASRTDDKGVFNAAGIKVNQVGRLVQRGVPVTINVASGTVSGGTGIHIASPGNAPNTIIAAGDVIGSGDEGRGILVQLGDTEVFQTATLTLSGRVSGGVSGTAIRVRFPGDEVDHSFGSGGSATIVLNSGALVGAVDRTAIEERFGNTSLTVNAGASLLGTVDLGGVYDGGRDRHQGNPALEIQQRGDDRVTVSGSVTGRLIGGGDFGVRGGDLLEVRSGGSVVGTVEGFEKIDVRSGGFLAVSGGF